MSVTQTFTVTVVGGNPSNHPYYNFGSSNKYAIDGSTATADVTLSLVEGGTYRFDQSDSSNLNHPLRFSTTPNGTHSGGSEYTTGVTTNGTPGNSGAYTEITVADNAPTLYYYCTNHSGMGWTANTDEVSKIFTVTVVYTPGGNKYIIDGTQQATVELVEGATFRFDQSDSSNSGHPLRLSTTSNGTHSGGSEYTTGVTTNGTPGSSGAYTQITVAASAPTLYYYCTNHSNMGGQANTPDTDFWGAGNWSANLWGISEAFTTGWGAKLWDSSGSWGEMGDETVFPTGVSATTAVGSVTVSAEINSGWGRQAWNDGGWGIQGTILLEGVSSTASVGSITPADVMGLTGVSSTSSVGSPTIISSPTVAITGVSATVSVGSITLADETIGLAGQAATSAVGSITPTDVMGLTGVSSTVSIGEVATPGDSTTIPTGVAATSAVGSVAVIEAIGVTGLSATSAVGSITPADVIGITGLEATASVAAFGTATGFGIQAYSSVDTGSNSSYTNVATGSNTSYTDAA